MKNYFRSNKLYFWISVFATVLVIVLSLYKFYFKKDYYFVVEVSCDPSTEECIHRSCEEEECPPNEYEDYLIYAVKASDFSMCKNDDCTELCRTTSKCEEVSN